MRRKKTQGDDPPSRPVRSNRLAEKKKRQEQEALEIPENNTEAIQDGGWTLKEEARLLDVLRKHGSRYPEPISKHIPTRTDEQVKSKLNKLKVAQKYVIPSMSSLQDVHTIVTPVSKRNPVRRQRDNAIETWIGILEGDCVGQKPIAGSSGMTDAGSKSVQFVLDMIAKCENHPRPEEVGGVDYAAIYESMASLMAGEAHRDLNKATSNKVLDMMSRLLACVQEESNVELTRHQRAFLSTFRSQDLKCNTGKNKQLQPEVYHGQMDIVNVLQLPPSFMTLQTSTPQNTEHVSFNTE